MAKITFIGAGSVEFTRNVLADVLTFPELSTATISLHDVDPDRLATAEAMASWTNERLGTHATVEAHLDRRAALDGTDYAINAIAVGGLAATKRDFELPKRFGLRQTIADTLGIGGIFRGLRTIPVAIGIGRDMAEVSPDAWLFNYTNPMTIVPRVVYEGTPFARVVGLCHSVRDTHETLAGLVGVPVEEVAFTTAGVNHQAFVLQFERDGENLYPRLDDRIAGDPEGLGRKVRVEMYRRLGYFPTESSEHSSEYVPWFLRSDEMVERFRIPIDQYVEWSEENLEEYESIKRALEAGQGFEIEPTGELASLAIHSIETGTPRVIYGNVRNDGLISNLPAPSCIEVPCLVDRAGFHPTRIGAMPPQLAALNQTFLNVSELTVRAALDERREHVYQAAMLDPNASSTLTLDEIQALCDELIEAHGELMPEWLRA